MATMWEVRYTDPVTEQEQLFAQVDVETEQGRADLISNIAAAHATGAVNADVYRELMLEG